MNELDINNLQVGDFLNHKDSVSMVAKVCGIHSSGVVVNVYMGYSLYAQNKKIEYHELRKWHLLGQNLTKRSR